MRIVFIILLSLLFINCDNKKFSSSSGDPIVDENTLPTDPNEPDPDPTDPTDPTDPDPLCPRYDLVVKSTHTSNKKLNFTFTFNGEMTHKTTEGTINLQFPQMTSCSGAYTNTTVATSLIPLHLTEELTGEVVITNGATCTTPARVTTIIVIDSATNKAVYSEQQFRSDVGFCEFGYSTEGNTLRNQIISIADQIAAKKCP